MIISGSMTTPPEKSQDWEVKIAGYLRLTLGQERLFYSPTVQISERIVCIQDESPSAFARMESDL